VTVRVQVDSLKSRVSEFGVGAYLDVVPTGLDLLITSTRFHISMRWAEFGSGSRVYRLKRSMHRPLTELKTAGLTDRRALATVLSQPENRYLARQHLR
jgi:hypothetical protein